MGVVVVVVVVVLGAAVVSSVPSVRHAAPANIKERPNPHSCALTERVAENSEVELNRKVTARLACFAVRFMAFVGLSKWLPKRVAQKSPLPLVFISVPGATS